MLDLILGISLFLIGLLILGLQFKKYLDGYKMNKEDTFGKAALYNIIALGILLIMFGIYYIF